MEFKILETGEGGKQDILSAPKITVLAGQEGQIKVYDEKEGNGIFCTVLVTETASGLETLTTVTVKAEGKESLNTSQKTIIKK